MDDLFQRMVVKPREIFDIHEQPETWVDVDSADSWEISAANTLTRCKWTPFEGWQVKGRIRRVVMRGAEIYRDGQVLAQPGSGKNIRISTQMTL
jgi:carbamoyl-phosphate synthase/aspartate carbamoyltransferase/dihydroorotase